MKRGAIALAILVGLAFTLPLMGKPPIDYPLFSGHIVFDGCDCTEGSGCWCGGIGPEYIVPQFPDFLNGLRDADFYYGEDDEYMYFKATETDPETHLYEADANGDALMSFSFEFLEEFHTAYYEE